MTATVWVRIIFGKFYIPTVNRIPVLLALVIGFPLTLSNAMAQQLYKQKERSGRNATIPKAAGTQHTTSTKSSFKTSKTTKGFSKTSKATAPSVASSAASLDEGAKALEAQDVERVTAFEQERIQAEIKKNKSWFDNYLAEDLTSAASDGRVEDKVEVIARCLDPSNIVESEKYDELSVRPYGDVIVVTGTRLQTGKGSDVPYSIRERFTDVWVSRGGLWRQVAMQVSPIAATDGASQSATAPISQPQSTKAVAASGSQSPAATPASQEKVK